MEFSTLNGYKVKDSKARELIETLENNVENKIEELEKSTWLFDNVTDMLANANLLSVGDIVHCLAFDVNKYPSTWEIIDQVESTPVHLICGDYTAKFLPNGAINVLAIGIPQGIDITTQIQWLLDNGFKNLYFPEGWYQFNLSLPENTIIRGAGENYANGTKFACGSADTPMMTLNGNFITLENFYSTTTDAMRSVTALQINESPWVYHCTFRNLVFENFKYGFMLKGTMIWCEFFNVAFIGSFDTGFYASTTGFCNLNSFYSCRFNNNVNYGVYLDLTETQDFTNTFYGCNFEQNAQDRFGQLHNAKCAVFNTGNTNFVGCYFEYNGDSDDDYSVITNDTTSFIGCNFTLERNLVHGNADSNIIMLGCKGFDNSGTIHTDSYAEVILFGNDFIADETNIYYTDVCTNRKKAMASAESTIDCRFPIIYYTHNSIETIANASEGQIIYVVNEKYETNVSAEIMKNGESLTIPVGKVQQFLIHGEKLIAIN